MPSSTIDRIRHCDKVKGIRGLHINIQECCEELIGVINEDDEAAKKVGRITYEY